MSETSSGLTTTETGHTSRFVQVPRRTMENELKTSEREAAEELSNLTKKAKYLEKTLNEAQSQLKDIVSLIAPDLRPSLLNPRSTILPSSITRRQRARDRCS